MSGGTMNVKYNQNSPITVNNSFLNQLPEKYAQSLTSFTKIVNNEIQKGEENIAPESTGQLKKDLNGLAEESTALNKGQLAEEKKRSIRDRLKGVATSLVRMSPKIARTVINFTPLAPFSDLVEEGFEKMVSELIPA
jgi:tyrosyl-tRNA synthetase